MPTRDDEKWRFSDARTLSLEGYAPAKAPTPAQAADLIARSRLISNAAGLIVHVDGHCVLKPTISAELAAKGVVFESLEDAVRTRPALLQEHLLKHPVLLGGDKFAALHRAWLRAGYVLHVPKGVEVKQPFVSVTWTLTDGVAVFPHALIVAGERAVADVHDFHLSAQADQRALAISAADIHAGTGSQVRRLAVQAWGSATQSFQVDNTCGGRDALIKLGQRRRRLPPRAPREQRAHRRPRRRRPPLRHSVASGEQEFDQRTLQIHAAGEAKSDLLFKNALLGKARTIFSGLIKVAPDAPAHRRLPDQPQPPARRTPKRTPSGPRDRSQTT
jgi:Fe-S cluster assembly protein SufD